MDKTFNLLGHTVSIQPEQGNSWHESSAIPGITPGGRVGATEQLLDKVTLAASMERLKRYKAGKAALERRIIDNENWYRLRHWQQVEKKPSKPGLVDTPGPRKVSRPASAWLFNSLANKHADAMDNYPEPVVLPREQGDESDAKSLSAILPVVLERNDYEKVYSDAWWDKLKSGTAAYGVFWDSAAENGLGDIAIRDIDMLNIYWQPGVTDIQDSPHLYITTLVDNDVLTAQYPQLQGKLGGQSVDIPDYIHDDNIDNSGKSVVIDWYYKINRNGKTVLHYCKFCADTVLFASEGNPDYDDGWYSHGQYPVVLDVLFPIKGSPAGFGYVDIMRDPQLYIDSLDEIILNNARLAGTPRWFIRDNAGIIPRTAWVPDYLTYYSSKGLYKAKGSYTPKGGDIIIYGSNSHVGLVESCANGKVITIEGNTSANGNSSNGDGVYRRARSLTDSWIKGYCVPEYEEEQMEIKTVGVKNLDNGKIIEVEAINVAGSNYIKLRDVEKLFPVIIDWDGKNPTIGLNYKQ